MSDDYEPKFARVGTTRRVLGHITDDDHMGRGARNTLARLVQELAEDPNTTYAGDVGDMREYLEALEEAELISRREDGTFVVTDAGRYELTH
jgi:hypothetical protein